MEADDDGLYVLKFRGAGQGPKALAAEIVGGRARRARSGCRCPSWCSWSSTRQLGAAEPDPEIQELIAASAGLNLGLDFLPGLAAVHPQRAARTPELAADVVWLDSLMLNVDRTPRNPNLLRWHGDLWLIDHGAALYVHHGGGDPLARRRRPLPGDPRPRAAARSPARSPTPTRASRRGSTGAALEAVAALVPDDWRAAERALRRAPAAPARGAARLGRGGRAMPAVTA